MEPPAPKAQAVSLVSCNEKIFVRSVVLECYSAALLQNAILFTIPCPARFVNTFILYYYGRTALDGCRRHAVQWMLYPRCGSAPRPGRVQKGAPLYAADHSTDPARLQGARGRKRVRHAPGPRHDAGHPPAAHPAGKSDADENRHRNADCPHAGQQPPAGGADAAAHGFPREHACARSASGGVLQNLRRDQKRALRRHDRYRRARGNAGLRGSRLLARALRHF